MKDNTNEIEVIGASQVKSNEVSLPLDESTSNKQESVLEASLEDIAKTAHNVVGAYIEGLGGQHLPWEKLTDQERAIGIDSVKILKNQIKPVSALHDHWILRMIEQGWVHGEVYSESKRTHPLMLDYRNLPKEERTKDKLFHLVVKSF